MKILLVDDSRTIRNIQKRALNEIGYRGWLILETSSPSRDVVKDTRKNLQYLKRLFGGSA